MADDIPGPPYRVWAVGPFVQGDVAAWWVRRWRIGIGSPEGGRYLWVGCHQGCCTANSNQLTIIDHPRNDPEAVAIIEAESRNVDSSS